jgi:catalase
MIMWLMSDRAIPRSYRMMEGFGVHTFRFVNTKGEATFVKFHWKPLLGVHSVAWDEAQKISGKDPDFHRRDLWEAIESGNFPEWELGVQLIPEEDEHKYDFDLLDPTKIVPEELVPVQRIGKLTLNRNPDNFFAETEQSAFHVGHIVPGIDFTNDPLLQGRLFSYTDTQLIRLGGPNFQEIPINRPVVPVYNNQRDGFMRQTINRGKSSYNPNTIGNGEPSQVSPADGGFTSYPERVEARKVRARSKSFFDHFSQARLFLNSQSEAEKRHMVEAFSFELGKVNTVAIRERMLGILGLVDGKLAKKVGDNLGLIVPESPLQPINHSVPAGENPDDYQPIDKKPKLAASPALSMATAPGGTIETRKIAFLAADGVDDKSFDIVKKALIKAGAVVEVVAPRQGKLVTAGQAELPIDHSLLTAASVFYDAVYIPGGAKSIQVIAEDADAIHFLNEAFRHCKAIAADESATAVLNNTYFFPRLSGDDSVNGLLMGSDLPKLASEFILAISGHRTWEREILLKVPA